MKRQNICIIIITVCLLHTIACTNKKSSDKDNSFLYFNMDKIEKPKLKDVFSSIEIDTLELNDKSIIGKRFSGQHIIVVPDKYYIAIDNRYVINIFNADGTFVSSSIDCIGKGPKQYLIMQDIAYNYAENTIEVLDPFSNNIFVYNIDFVFLRKHKMTIKPKDRFRSFYPLQKDFYALIDKSETSTIHFYNTKTKESKETKYEGKIASITSNQSPFRNTNGTLYFIPPEVNNKMYVCNPQTGELIKYLKMEGSNWLNKKDIKTFNDKEEEISRYIFSESQKYTPLNRFINEQYVITLLIKHGKQYINIYNRKTNNHRTFSKLPSNKENIPTCVHLEDDVMYAFIQPSELFDFIDVDLVKNKEILKTIDDESNPCIVKYRLKM